MPSIRDKSTVEAIARGFIENKRNKTKGLLTAGYAKRYALTCGQKLYEDIRVKDAIAKIDAVSAEKAEVTVNSMRIQYDEDRLFAIACKSPSACVSASVSKARLYGMDKDAGVSVEKPKELSKERTEELERAIKGMQGGTIKIKGA